MVTAAKEDAAKPKSKYYPADDEPVRRTLRRKLRPTKLRSSITPGTVLILLAGKYKGKRVVFLKQLTSGLLLVTGPRALNGVRLKRVNQAYVIATSTKIDISSLDVAKYDDGFFKKLKQGEEVTPEMKQARKEEQEAVDKVVVGVIKQGEPELAQYISARFSLKRGMKPHELVF
ncbi:hypothetical protein SELMODRAFT_270686 [Selaginella moellendorffii]|uniref:60S ribosomal protein L6 n=1 Tax=Selaginella moellendorffii TaxID=88036 RepID=D8R9D2_SELML|nr:60S ribosomal protein L6 [Selaginella moellendorffii]EFJ31139.1 hypothetical protein SELMODRAFT_270686 [Selaginella moellendorffii]|eukprot:XP_002967792.1 60S ribosomal protein L6 [Selaginella moellendorffii]